MAGDTKSMTTTSLILLKRLFSTFYHRNEDQRDTLLLFLLNESFILQGTTPMAEDSQKELSRYISGIQISENPVTMKRKKKTAQKSKVRNDLTSLPLIGSAVSSWRCSGESATLSITSVADLQSIDNRLDLALSIIKNIFENQETVMREEATSLSTAKELFLNFLLDRLKPGPRETGSKHRLKLPPPYVLLRCGVLLFRILFLTNYFLL